VHPRVTPDDSTIGIVSHEKCGFGRCGFGTGGPESTRTDRTLASLSALCIEVPKFVTEDEGADVWIDADAPAAEDAR
jgi:hypothetical protein